MQLISQRFAFDQFKHKEAFSLGLFESVDGAYVGVIEGGQEFGLTLETLHSVGIAGEEIGQERKGDLAAQRKIVGEEDLAHASPAKLFTDSIVAKGLADHVGQILHIDGQCNAATRTSRVKVGRL